jgi:hypothetical protein
LTKKDIPFKWDGECQRAFEEIKAYLLNPPVLVAPIPGKELIFIYDRPGRILRSLIGARKPGW